MLLFYTFSRYLAAVLFGLTSVSFAIVLNAAEALPNRLDGIFEQSIKPILQDHCFGCHADAAAEGGFSFDSLPSENADEDQRRKWWTVMRKLRAGTMPPIDELAPNDEQKHQIDQWIKSDVFLIDPQRPDPGQVTLRRLNRVEYKNTISELLGVEYDTQANFPPDDTGHGFDNIGDVLTISSLLLEKYFDAARDVVTRAVPLVSGVPQSRYLSGGFIASGEEKWEAKKLPYNKPATLTRMIDVPLAGSYVVKLEVNATEHYVDDAFDYNKCQIVFRLDDEVVFDREFVRQSWTNYEFEFAREWSAGSHEVSLELIPLTPDEPSVRDLAIEFKSVILVGPDDPAHFEKPERYDRFFPDGPPPDDGELRRAYARTVIERFATRAFRRPVDEESLSRLVDLAVYQYDNVGKPFEAAVADAMIAMLASPRFLFREEQSIANRGESNPLVDEFSLATRLSYFLWSSPPDDTLMELARQGKLRDQLDAQVDRLMADPRSKNFFANFVGQWLQSRDIDSRSSNVYAVLDRERVSSEREEFVRSEYRSLRWKDRDSLTDDEKKILEEGRDLRRKFESLVKAAEPSGEVKRAMRRETEMMVEHLIRDNRPLQELLDSDYAFLNESLAEYYGIAGVEGRQSQKVLLPPDSVRGGLLTQATFLSITSNPDRTSPVKRGKFILENLLGTPTAAPPPNIPPLEELASGPGGRQLTLRESLEIHRENALCASCHNSMDPLGLALENFNALGLYRERESSGPIDPSGQLISGATFSSVAELKKILATKHRRELYTCVTEKMLTYATGRGVDYFDVETVDQIVLKLEINDGRCGDLLRWIVQSAPFQRTRISDPSRL